ncbi:Voltage-Dependent L-Type Calcium Channel Subunit Alpha-1C [Manis pentadactyla]|nr:Voltage-Dependent L-Type Calcium Channel Subunit Alpha-1C [Manis pentadactyla]
MLGQDAPSLPSGPASLGGWRWELQRALTWQPQAGLWEAPGQDLGTRQRRQVFPVLPEKKRVEVGLGIGEEIRGAPELGGSPGRRRGAAPRRVLLPPGSDFSPRCRLCGFQPVRLQERVDGSLRTKEAVQGAGRSGVAPASPRLGVLRLATAGGGGTGGLQGDARRSGHPRRGGGSAPYCVAGRAEPGGAEQVWWCSTTASSGVT